MVTPFIKNPKQAVDNIGLSGSDETVLVEQDRQRLEELFKVAVESSDPNHDDFSEVWNETSTPLLIQRSDNYIRDKWKAVENSNRRIALLRDRYAHLLSDDVLAKSNFLFSQLIAVENVLHGFSLVFEEALVQQKEIEAIKLICQGFNLIADNLLLYSDWFIRDRSGREMLVKKIGNATDINGFNEHFGSLDYESDEEKQILIDCRNSILRAMKSIQWELLMISGKSEKMPFFLGSEVVYLDANSAEGKALRRLDIMESEDDTDWIVVEPDDNIVDFEVLRERMESRGYKVRTKD